MPPPRFDAVRFEHLPPGPDEPTPGGRGRCADRLRRADRHSAAQGSVPQVRHRPPAATTWTAASASARPTCWPRSGMQVPAPKAYGTFVEYTHLVGALGFVETVRRLSGHRLLAVDEFELDDPGDTMLMTRLLGAALRCRCAPGRDVQHPAGQARRGPLRRRGLPPRDPCAVSTFRHAAGGRAGLPARRAGRRPRRRCRTTTLACGRERRPVRRPAWTRSTPSPTQLAQLHPSKYGRLVDGDRHRAPARGAPTGRSVVGAALGGADRPDLRPVDPGPGLRGAAGRRSSPRRCCAAGTARSTSGRRRGFWRWPATPAEARTPDGPGSRTSAFGQHRGESVDRVVDLVAGDDHAAGRTAASSRGSP